MKTSLLVTTFLGLLAFGSQAKDLTLADCPAAVQDTITGNLRDGKLDDIKTVNSNGTTHYIADIDLPGDRDLSIHIATDGSLVQVREEIALTEAPAPVQAAIQKAAATGAKIDEVKKVSEAGNITFIIDLARPQAPDLDLTISEDGTILNQSEGRDVQD